MRKIWKEKWFQKVLVMGLACWIGISLITLFQMHRVGLNLDVGLVEKVLLTCLLLTMVVTNLVVMIESGKTKKRPD
jgi:hypothetical protein